MITSRKLLAFEHTDQALRFVYSEKIGRKENLIVVDTAQELPAELKYIKLNDLYNNCEDLTAQQKDCESYVIWRMSQNIKVQTELENLELTFGL